MTSLKPATAVILLFLLAFPQVTATYFKALTVPFKQYSLVRAPSKALDNKFGASETLPQEAVDAMALAEKHKINAYFLSDGITKDELVYQRIIEALYPLVPTIESPYLFFKTGESVFAGCDMMDETPVVKLARCI